LVVSVEWARVTAQQQLEHALPRRWRHVQAVGALAEAIGWLVGPDAKLLSAAAWLHDVGYGPGLVDSGFHPLDGARWLRRSGAGDRLAALVAHHTGALIEAEERGLAQQLAAEFHCEESATADALWYCDLTTGPDGQTTRVEERIAEITTRYGADSLVSRFMGRAEPLLTAAVRRTERHMLNTSYPM
jgi:hypothetical protein